MEVNKLEAPKSEELARPPWGCRRRAGQGSGSVCSALCQHTCGVRGCGPPPATPCRTQSDAGEKPRAPTISTPAHRNMGTPLFHHPLQQGGMEMRHNTMPCPLGRVPVSIPGVGSGSGTGRAPSWRFFPRRWT